jgi:hypothetical protein
MRLWSLHPNLLDAKGLVALWREALLAKAVLEGKTKGYKNHSQLVRFKAAENPVLAINQYLVEVWCVAKSRGYNFDITKIGNTGSEPRYLTVNKDQLAYEFKHLQNKLEKRDPVKYAENANKEITPHWMFRVVEGPIESWEVTK